MKPKILFLGRFPPPVHGAAKMNELYFKSKRLRGKFDLKKIRINRSDTIEDTGKFNFKKLFGIFEAFFEVLYQLIFFRPNLIYFEIAPTGMAFMRDSLYVWLCKLFEKKIIFFVHARGMGKIESELSKKYHQLVFRNTKIVLLSKLLYQDVKEIIHEEKVDYLPNGIKNEITSKEFQRMIKLREKNKRPILLFLSNMIESKGPLEVLEICNKLNNKKIDFECWFVGAWADDKLEKKWNNKLKEYKLEKKCQYLGPKYGKDKIDVLKKTDFLVFPTRYGMECFPLVILEAFMFGIPVFSYNTGAIQEIISKDFLGKIGNDWDDLARELEKRFKKKIDSKKIRNHFEKTYILEIAEKRLMKILERNL